MPFLTQGKTNWKFIAIVVILAILVSGGILGYLNYLKKEIISLSVFPEIKKPEKIEKAKLPRFEDFLVFEEFRGFPALPNISSNPDVLKFVTEITEGAKKGPNFAGHYTIVEWGCGTECQSGVVVDAENGAIYPLSLSAFGRKFQLNSNLLIINPPETIKSLYPYYPYDESGKLPDWLYSENYVWKDNKFILIYKFQPEKIEDETANWKTYRNEEYGFEIKYPEGESIGYEGKTEYVIQSFKIDFGSFLITIWENSQKLPIRDYFIEESACVLNKPVCEYLRYNGKSFKIMQVSDNIEWLSPEDKTIKQVFISTTDGKYIINFLNRSLTENIFNQMLSTFKFLE